MGFDLIAVGNMIAFSRGCTQVLSRTSMMHISGNYFMPYSTNHRCWHTWLFLRKHHAFFQSQTGDRERACFLPLFHGHVWVYPGGRPPITSRRSRLFSKWSAHVFNL